MAFDSHNIVPSASPTSAMPRPQPPSSPSLAALLRALMAVGWGTVLAATEIVSLLNEESLATGFMSRGLWLDLTQRLGGTAATAGPRGAVPFTPVFLAVGAFSLITWLIGGAWMARRNQAGYVTTLARWGFTGWVWWLLPMAWEAADLIAATTGCFGTLLLLRGTLPLAATIPCAGWIATGLTLLAGGQNHNASSPPLSAANFSAGTRPAAGLPLSDNFSVASPVWMAAAAYALCFTVLNWQLYRGLLLPHGDSAMYEEHIWNLLHGKGFRSYLDNGRLFLGEHLQVIHLLLIPLYLLWPSQMLLELSQSVGLACGAIPVYWLARRHSGNRGAAILLAGAYLLYFPMQALDISVDFKTFRPSAFEIPFLLFGLDALERGRLRAFFLWLGLCLLCQEDAAMVIAPLGVWMACSTTMLFRAEERGAQQRRWLGAGLAVAGFGYVVFVIKVALPWFRGGQDVHFASYFSQFGHSTSEIVWTILTQPQRLWQELFVPEAGTYLAGMLIPLGCLPLLSPGRAAVAAPLFGILCLNTLARSPLHHFHAPLVPILFWAAAAGLGNAPTCWIWLRQRLGLRNRPAHAPHPVHIDPARRLPTGKHLPSAETASPASPVISALPLPPVRSPGSSPTTAAPGALFVPTAAARQVQGWLASFSASCALVSGIFFSVGPLGLAFWDPHSAGYWRQKYVPGERVAKFAEILSRIPPEKRVASTDFIHPRFTHHARSYDYSDYRPQVPDDADFIVIDVAGPYSKVRTPADVKEYREHPEVWELWPDRTGGYFIVLERRRL